MNIGFKWEDNLKKYIKFFEDCSNYYMSIAKNEFQQLHIKRKIEHCKRVNKLSIEIAQKLGLSNEEIFLINVSSLFHDVGRFKQFYEYSTYNDKISCNHALLSIEILEQEKVLDDLESAKKEIILEIIKLHNYKTLPKNISEKLYTYASIIRDADKIDWIYAMVNIIPNLSKENQAVFYSNKEERNYISEKLLNSILNDENIVRDELDTIDELRVASMGWITSDMKCKPSYEIIKREDLINKTFNLISDSKEKRVIFDYIINKI